MEAYIYDSLRTPSGIGKKTGMPVGPLAVSDEVSLKLILDIMQENPDLTYFEKEL